MSAVLGSTPDTGGAAAAALLAPSADSASGRVSPDQNDSVRTLSIYGRTVTVKGQTYLMRSAALDKSCVDGRIATDTLKDSPVINGFIAGRVSEIKVVGESPYYRLYLTIGEQNFEADAVYGSSDNIVFISRANPANRVIFSVNGPLLAADNPLELTLALHQAFENAVFRPASAKEFLPFCQAFSVRSDVPTGTYALCYHPRETCFVLTTPTGKVEKLSVKEDGEQAYKFSNGLCFKTNSSFKKGSWHAEQITFDVGTLAA